MAQKSLTYKQYRTADLTIFLVIYLVIEALLASLSLKFSNVNFTFTLVYAIAAIVTMRWGAFSAIHLALGGVVYALCLKGDALSCLGFILGNLFGLLSLITFKFLPKEKITKSFTYSLIYLVIVYLTISLGRAISFSVINKVSFLGMLTSTLTTDVFSLVISIIVILVARRQDGLFEDQKQYLLRTQKERNRDLQNTTYDEDEL